MTLRRQLIVTMCALLFTLSTCLSTIASRPTPASAWQTTVNAVAGTWTGTSTCVGNRPACKNETVVFRFVPLEGHPTQVRLLADKIIDGKRVAMGALVFDVDETRGVLRNEFKSGQTHGVWSYAVAGDTMTGTLMILPEGTVGRDVKVRRASDDSLPEAPPASDYEE